MLYLNYPFLFLAVIGIAAVLYSSVGHGGASGYLAAMALFGLDPDIMKPAALTMNIFVTLLVLWRCHRVFQFNWRLCASLTIASVPFAYLGGAYTIESILYKLIVGVLLILAALRMFWKVSDSLILKQPNLWVIAIVGSILGFISGLTGVGGGIFLSPLLLMFQWTNIKESIPIAAAFILFNSTAGICGYLSVTEHHFPSSIPLLVAVAVIGALFGSELATRKLSTYGIHSILGIVLAIAGSKMILTA